MAILKEGNLIYEVAIQSEEIGINKVRLNLNHEISKAEAIGSSYHDALWNFHELLESNDLQLLCNGLSLNVYPSAMQLDMGLGFTAMHLQMGKHSSTEDIVNLLDADLTVLKQCKRQEQLGYYNRWVLSKKRSEPKEQKITVDLIEEEDEFVFFWGHQSSDVSITKSCLSQWWPCRFYHKGIEYSSAEQWMMAEKARLFSDFSSLDEILSTSDPKTIKEIGRRISFFDAEAWDRVKYDIVYEGNLLKFSQDSLLKSFLLSTDEDVLVEASPYDTIWGIGMKESDTGVDNPENWKGLNLLGFTLMEVRDRLANESIPSSLTNVSL